MDIDDTRIGLALLKLRQQERISAKDLSLAAGLPDYTVSRIERGKLRLDLATAVRLTYALGLTVNDLIDVALGLSSEAIERRLALDRARDEASALRAALRE